MLFNIKTIKFKKLRALAMCLIIGICLFASSNVSAEFQPNETKVTNALIIDNEYDQATSQFTWVDNVGNLWIGKLDSDGMFDPPSGKAILVDPGGAMYSSDLKLITNGPEWVLSDQGPQIAYTKFPIGASHTIDNATLGLAQLISGQWEYKSLNPQLPRFAPYGSKNDNDPDPRITYFDPAKNHYWCSTNNPAEEHLIPLNKKTMRSVRWVQGGGARALVFSASLPTDDDICQVFKYDIDTELLQQLTYDNGNKCNNPPWMWSAPEYNNEFVCAVTVNNRSNSELRIYKQDNTQAWAKIMTVPMPLNSQPGSIEPFTYKQKSYVFFQLSTSRAIYPTSIWVANIDPQKPFLRKVSDDTLLRYRFDPEVYVVPNQGPYIYYSRSDLNKQCHGQALCYEGIYRAYTGIAP